MYFCTFFSICKEKEINPFLAGVLDRRVLISDGRFVNDATWDGGGGVAVDLLGGRLVVVHLHRGVSFLFFHLEFR